MIRFFNPGKTYKKNKEVFVKEIDRVLSNGDLILRQDVEDFEKNLAEYIGTKYAVALNSGTDALYLALKALNIGVGDEVLVASRTFVATPQEILKVGATPIFYDTDFSQPIKWKHLKAIIPVHIEGAIDTNMDKILALAKKWQVPVIEDAAQALGAVYVGGLKTEKQGPIEVDYRELKKAGSIGNIGCFSFYPAKILGAFGDAGGLTTNDEKIFNYVKKARNHFNPTFDDWGVNSRLDNLQATILNVRFKDLQSNLNRRQEIAEMYDNGLQGTGLTLPLHTEGRVWQDYVVRCPDRDGLYEYLKENGVETLKNNYPFPVPKLPLAQIYEDETLRLPCNDNVTDEEVDEIISLIKNR